MCLVKPLLSQLGHSDMDTIALPLTMVPIIECSGWMSFASSFLAYNGALQLSPAKQNGTISHNNLSKPDSLSRSDTPKS
jgi:hypothetical protein